MDTQVKTILKILNGEQIKPSASAKAMCEKIMARHEGRVQAMIYYGSSLRAMNDPEKMLDFYVLVDSYAKTHRSPVRRLLNALIPPAVYYLENKNKDGSVSNCKYSIISLSAFEKKCGRNALLSQIWGRFSQPCVLLYPKDDAVSRRIQMARVKAIQHMAHETVPLVDGPVSATRFWARGFMESYKTELRPESSVERSEEIVTRYLERYEAIMAALHGDKNEDGKFTIPEVSGLRRFSCRSKWLGRRIVGKPATAIRALNGAFTFDNGLDYVLHKLKSHSGATIEVSDSQRRHPILWSPVLGWKLYRKGAFK